MAGEKKTKTRQKTSRSKKSEVTEQKEQPEKKGIQQTLRKRISTIPPSQTAQYQRTLGDLSYRFRTQLRRRRWQKKRMW